MRCGGVGCRCWFSVPRNRYWRAGDVCVVVWVAGVGSQFLAIATGVLVMAVLWCGLQVLVLSSSQSLLACW